MSGEETDGTTLVQARRTVDPLADMVMRQEVTRAVHVFLQDRDFDDRFIYEGVCDLGWNLTQIAERLHVSPQAVQKRWRRLLNEGKAALTPYRDYDF